jgi:co-chaperonin GroES (HSP10)
MSKSGIKPTEYNCLVEPRVVEETTKGGIILSQDIMNLDQNAQTQGVLVAMSPMAFVNPDWPKGAELPKVGDTIAYARYAGASSKIVGNDGVDYIIIKDKEITAVIEGKSDE